MIYRIATAIVVAILINGPAESADSACHKIEFHLDRALCYDAEVESLDAKIRGLIDEARASIEQNDDLDATVKFEWKDYLIRAQQHWQAYRDLHCKDLVAMSFGGGSGTGLAVAQCLIRKTQERLEELENG